MKDLTGQRFGRLVAIEPVGRSKDQLVVWRCVCDCGRECEVVGSSLTKGNTRSCGCLRAAKRTVDLSGQRFGRLVAIRPTSKRVRDSVVWECACDCGATCEAPVSSLRTGQVKSCGCLRREARKKDLSGQRFGRLTAVRPAGRKNGYVLWECRCDCGNTKHATTNQLTTGKVRSCGCLRRDLAARDAAGKSLREKADVSPRSIAGKRFGRLTAIEPTDARDRGSVVWRCVCECGTFCDVPRRRLTGGTATSCGCTPSR